MNARERDLIRERFVDIFAAAKAREIEAIEAMTQAIMASSDNNPLDWQAEIEAARAEAAVFRALLDAEAIATGEARAVPVAKGAGL